jgi:FAD/FMN-containing dehydrogenase
MDEHNKESEELIRIIRRILSNKVAGEPLFNHDYGLPIENLPQYLHELSEAQDN